VFTRCYRVKIRPHDLDLWAWKSLRFQIFLRNKYVPSFVKIHWKMLILEYSEGCYGVKIKPCDLWPWKSIGFQGPVSQNRTISDLSYDHLLTKFATVSQNLSECFYDFRLVVMTSSLCGGTNIYQFTRAVHLSDKFIYSSKSNIKYSYFIGLCRYKSCDTLKRFKTTVSKQRLFS
jgi:hypothetical protein